MVAMPWFLLEFTESIAFTSGILAIKIFPILISTLYGSWILDKYSKRMICIVSDILSASAILMIPILFKTDLLTIAPLILIIAFSSILEQISSASLSSMVPDLLENSSMRVEKLNGIVGSLHNFGDLAGPVAGGFIVAAYGSVIALGIDALTFLISAIVFIFFITPHKPIHDHDHQVKSDNIVAGFQFLASQYCIFFVAVLSVIVNLLIIPLLTLILPFVAKTQLDSALNFGILISIFGAGTFFASIMFTAFGHRVDKLVLIYLCNALLLLCFLAASFTLNMYALACILFFVGISVGFFGPLDDTLLQMYTPKSLRGRVFLAYSTLRYITVPVSMVIFGFLLESISLSVIFIIMAFILFITLLWLLSNRKKFKEESVRLADNVELSGVQ
jgi:MFS family permease